MVTVDGAPAGSEVTVSRPVDWSRSADPADAEPTAQVNSSLASKFVTATVYPSAVRVGVPNVGSSASASDVAAVAPEPPMWPDLVVVTVRVDSVAGATPITVASPVPSIVTADDVAVAVPFQPNVAS